MNPLSPLFLAALVLATGILLPPAAAQAREIYDLKFYQLKSDEKAALFDKAMEEAAIPALKGGGASTVGVFRERADGQAETNSATRYVLTVYPSPQAYAGALTHDYGDVDFGDHLPYLFGGKDDAAFERVEGSLMLAFDGFPALVDPEGDGGDDRYFELRTYESPSEGKAVLKVEMFNKGELDIFEKVGLTSVFYGQAVVAPNLPQLTYMVVYENEDAQQAAWDAFRTSPDWEKLKGEERYADTVSNITSKFLVALPYSGIR
ncbi:NIPSNAP family protein [soil metagenome]